MKKAFLDKMDKILDEDRSVNVTSTTGHVENPSYEEISEKATELYYQRIDRGEDGSAFDDWVQAEAFLKEN